MLTALSTSGAYAKPGFYFFSPDSSQSNLGLLNREMDTFFSESGYTVEFQCFAHQIDFDKRIQQAQAEYFFIPEWYIIKYGAELKIKRLLIPIRNGGSTYNVEKAKMATAMLGIEIAEAKIEKPEEFRNAFGKIVGKMQAFWILQDPNVFTVDNMNWLTEQAKKEKIMSLGQSENIVKSGATLAITIDEHNIGVQAASISKDILSGDQKPKDIGVMAPLGTNIYLNMKTANQIGLEIPPDAKNSVTKIFEE